MAGRGTWRTALLLVALALAALGFRSFVAAPRLVPSESMLPALWPGDFLLVAKWSYGYSRYSLPLELPLWRGRILARTPARGDIVVFRRAGSDHDQVKRVIGLPGDTIALQGGAVRINGRALPRVRIADLVVPVTPNTPCHAAREPGPACRYRRFTETLPDGRSHAVLDSADLPVDAFAPVVVPPGQLFLLGDNRDRSADSRAFGTVPLDRVIGRPILVLWSSDGNGRRAGRIGPIPR